MRIVQLTPGTGSFFCGTCIRDNALVSELKRQGHDAVLLPMYLPMTLDEPSSAEGSPLFYGGVNVYLQQTSALVRSAPTFVRRALDSPRVLKIAAKRAAGGMTSAKQLGELTLSMLKGEEGRQRAELDRLCRWMEAERPEAVLLSNALLMGLVRELKRRTGAIVACTLQGEDYFLDDLPSPYRQQCWDTLAERAAEADLLMPVSRYYGGVMAQRCAIPAERMAPLWNGISLEGYKPRTTLPAEPAIGYLARMCPLKGLETLLQAYIHYRKDPQNTARLRICGSCTAGDEKFVASMKRLITDCGLQNDIDWLPNVSRQQKIDFLSTVSLLSVPAEYGESFGLYLLEAWAAGVPVVQPNHAAFPELVHETGGGELVEPGKPHLLADAWARLLNSPRKLLEMGRSGRAAVEEKFTVQHMAGQALQLLRHAADTQGAEPRAAGV
jgi:glycosyltransferase involved in cell wall biosynthesis